MKREAALALIIGVFSLTESASASETFKCDAPGGRFSEYQRTLAQTATGAEATIKINQLRRNARWVATTSIDLVGEKNTDRVGVRLTAGAGRERIDVFVSFPGRGQLREAQVADIKSGDTIQIALQVSPLSGRVSVNGKGVEGPGFKGVSSLYMSCSGADVEIKALVAKESAK